MRPAAQALAAGQQGKEKAYFMRIWASVLCGLLLGCPSKGSQPARFVFTDVDPTITFVIEIHDPKKIEHARRVLAGQESRIHVQGTIEKSKASYNEAWSYHLNPESIDFFELATEVCDSTIQYVEEHLEEVGGAFLPNGHWCPWSSRLVREL